MSDHARLAGVEVLHIPQLGRSIRPIDDLVACWKLWRLLRRVRPTIVHTHTAKAGTLGRIAAFLARVPIRVHTYHGHVFHGYFSRANSAIFIGIEQALARVTTKIITISPSQRADLARYLRLSPDRLMLVPLGLELARVRSPNPIAARAEFRRSIGAHENDMLVGLIGRLVPIKNHVLAFDAIERLAPAHPSLKLVLVGGGELESTLHEEARRRKIVDRIIFAGWREDLSVVYAGCDAVMLTSDNEGTPVCLIEALAAGRPVIATDVGGVSDVLDGGRLGLLVPPRDPESLARGLSELLSLASPATERRTVEEEVIARYSVERLAADMVRLYDELQTENRRNSSRIA
jgi:glycosyltransferase involved in cell wall biosynthesis